MRKELREIIENLKDVVALMRASHSLANLAHENRIVQQIGRLSELAKPDQYVVSIIKNHDTGVYYGLIDGNRMLYWADSTSLDQVKANAFAVLNDATKNLSLPLITIDQITFVEPEA